MRVLGLDPVAQGGALRPRIGVMLQSGGVYPGAHAEEMLRHTARLYADPVDPALLIERLGLESCGRTTYRRLSGGQQQRLALAMAVVGRPELVFLDEPTAGLDPQARHATWDLVRELRADGVTVVLTTHFMDEAEQLADQVVIIDGGRSIAARHPRGAVPRRRGEHPALLRPPRASTWPRCSRRCPPTALPPSWPPAPTASRARSTRNCWPPSPPGAPSTASCPTTSRWSGAPWRTSSWS